MVPIGIATSAGDIEIGHVRMPGPATLYEGALVETGSSPAQVSLRNGVVVHLSSEATATIHVDSVSLERGASQVDAPRDYLIRARAVTFTSTSQPSRARLQVLEDGTLQMAAILGSFDVHLPGVASVGKVMAGTSLTFARGAAKEGTMPTAQVKGCLAKSEKGYLLQDEGSKTVFTLMGGSIHGKSGDRVTVTGKADGTVVTVLRLTIDGHGCPAQAVFAAAGAKPARGIGSKVATVAGVATASTPRIAIIGAAATSAALIPTIALTSSASSPSSGGSSSSSISPSSR